MCSTPTENRINPWSMPRWWRSSAETLARVIVSGWFTSDSTPTQTLGQREHLHRLKKERHTEHVTPEVDAHHAGEATHLLPSQTVTRKRYSCAVPPPFVHLGFARRQTGDVLCPTSWACCLASPLDVERGEPGEQNAGRIRRRGSGFSRRSGRHSTAILATRRARFAPRHRCLPAPNATCLAAASRCGSNASESGKTASSRFGG